MKYHSVVSYAILFLYIVRLANRQMFSKNLQNFELNLDKIANKNPYLIVILGDYNGNWYKQDTTTCEGSKIDAITSHFGLKQLIQKPIHILNDSSSCIDLLFTSQPNVAMESGVHSSLHQNCHHQLIYAKVDLKVFYPHPYEREIWHYQRANIDLFQRAIEHFS